MPLLCIGGSFRVTRSEPDGDSIRFYPDDPAAWDRVSGPYAVKRNPTGGAELRLDAIDALETHYSVLGGVRTHQPLDLAHAARDELLRWLGFRRVERTGELVTATAPDDRPGYVLTRGADVHGRCVALAGRGTAPGTSGEAVFATPAMVRRTANHHLLTLGLAYPTFYRRLYHDLRAELAAATVKARAATAGVWARDATLTGVTIATATTLSDDAVVLPKLFRRLVDYLHLGQGDLSLAGLPDQLRRYEAVDRLFVLSTGHSTHFDTVVEVQGQVVRMTLPPEDLVFDER